MIKRTTLMLLATVAASALGGESEGPPSLDPQLRTLDLKFVTPHLPLLKKHAKGEFKAFFLVPADSTLGHVREIVQRADIVPAYCAVTKLATPADGLHAGDLAEFREKLNAAAPQVLVTLGVNWHAGLKAQLIGELLGRVREGMGTVVAVRDLKGEPELAAALAAGKELDAPPLPAVGVSVPTIRRFAVGKGRVALVVCPWRSSGDAGEAALGDWATLRLARETTQIEELRWRGFEYSYAFLADAARWAAGQETAVAVTDAALKGDAVLVSLHNAGDKVMTRVYVTVRSRRWEARTHGEVQAELSPGESRHLVTLGKAPDGGPLALEVHVRGGDSRTLAFGSVGASAFEAIRMRVLPQPPFQSAAKPGACVVELEGSVPGGNLDVRVEDRFGHLVDRSTHVVRLQGGKAHVAFLLQGFKPLCVYHEIVARFYSVDAPERLTAEATADVFLLPPRPSYADGFALGVWGAAQRTALMLQAMLRTTHDLGLTLHSHAGDDRVLYATGGSKAARVAHSVTDRYARKDEKPRLDGGKLILYPPLLPSPEAVQAAKEEWQKRVRLEYDTGARFVGIDDERQLADGFDCHPQTLGGFREWLRKRYADIAELNRTWGTQFAGFAQVVPKRRRDLGASLNLAPWLEFRMFIGDVLGDYYVKAPADWAAEIAPDLSVGEWGIAEPSAAWPVDWSRYAQCYKHTARCGGPQGVLEDLFRSFAPGTRHGLRMREGMQPADPARRIAPWLSLAAGGSFAWFGEMCGDGSLHDPVLTSDQRPTAGYAALAKDVFPGLTGGVDRLIFASKFSPDPIAIAYSYPSWLADPDSLAREAKVIVEELGFQHLYVTVDDVAAGRLEKDGFKLLVIQQASCLSKEQVEGVRRFAEAGGIVLCIGRAGWRDLHGAPHAEGCLLDALTGVDTAKAAPLGRTMRTPAGEPLLTLAVAHGGIAVAKDATVLANVAPDDKTLLPVWTVRDLGKGKVYWLNASVALGGPEAVRKSQWDIFDHVIAMASLTPRCRLFAGGQPLFDAETWYYETPSGRTLLVAHYLARKVESPVTDRFQRKGIVYEVISKRAVGDSESIQDTFPEGTMRVYAILDYRCLGMTAKLEDNKVNPGDVLRVRCTIKISSKDPAKTADLHPIRLWVLGPSGELPGYRTVVLAQDGEATAEFRLALDEAPGSHSIHALDVISGQEARATFTVLKPDAKGR